MKNAEWIWYKGDVERYITDSLSYKRTYRGVVQVPFWARDTYNQTVHFTRHIILADCGEIKVESYGEIEVNTSHNIVMPINMNKKTNAYPLPKGEYDLVISCFNLTSAPVIRVSGAVVSDGGFVCSLNKYRGKTEMCGHSAQCNPYQINIITQDVTPKIEKGVFDSSQQENGAFISGTHVFDCESFGSLHVSGTGNGKLTAYFGESTQEAADQENNEVLQEISFNNGGEFGAVAMKALTLKADGDIKIDKLTLKSELNSYLPATDFACDDSSIKQIYDVALRTLRLCSREGILDGIKRDRWCWSGDVYQGALMNYYSIFDPDCVRRSIISLMPSGIVSMHINHIPDYTMFFILTVFDYYKYVGKTELLQMFYPELTRIMEFCASKEKDGFLAFDENDWIFIDWGNFDKDGILSAEQVLYWAALKTFSKISALVGNSSDQKKYKAKAQALKKNIIRILYDSESHTFKHNEKGGNTRYAGSFAIIYGFFQGETEEQMLINAYMNNNRAPELTTPYAQFYELDAYGKCGYTDRIISRLHSYWGGMLSKGATSFWEAFDQNEKDSLNMYGRPYGKSLCHAWGATPLYLIGRYLLGVKRLDDGSYEVQPYYKGKMSGSVKTADGGYILVEINGENVKVTPHTQFKVTVKK